MGSGGSLLRAVRSLYEPEQELGSHIAGRPSGGQFTGGSLQPSVKRLGMRISTSKSEGHGSRSEKGGVPSPVWVERSCLKWKEFKYLGVLFTSEGKMEREIDRWIGTASAVMQLVGVPQGVKKELSRKVKLSIYRSVYASHSLTYGHELWSRCSFSIERSQLRWLGGRHLFWMPPGRLPREVFQACPTGRRPRPRRKTQDTLERLCLSAGLGTPRNPPRRAGGSVWGEGSLGISAQTAASMRPGPGSSG
ncbi:hypothetical protein L3Q82_022385 [Scortum barcoo]|uniref:Uncharacterized protein n=1 Tax=Scortum barcoo TaxID=214431 RepID=A0ACB8X1D4_9TELE|nr:hypothetical protein L3Q82_022385 [Scortum barcoo]